MQNFHWFTNQNKLRSARLFFISKHSLDFYPFPLFYSCKFCGCLASELGDNRSRFSCIRFMLLQVNCVLREVQFTDQQRFKQLVFEFKARMQVLLWTFIQQSSIVLILNINFQILEFIFCHFQNLLGGSGHKITASRMEAKLNVSGWMAEQMFGIRLEWNFQATCLLDLFCIS